ncbi:phage capsid protein [Vibrio chagasii]|uniref:Phage capsid protein n=2 Tax=Vibrio chagasii TaxID=170679 RepID=A0A7Y3YU08_9VIBR|nr:GPO family capsid scaffolding protein [Vibrio chagasii]NOH35613.1 phage capsid protein [Vibrio chagasii]
MFKSEPFCALTAGETIDGRVITQQDIDDVAETYDPKFYNARINDNHDHSRWSTRLGSVLSAEARGEELWLTIKPNSHLLRNVESGQLLHQSAEIKRNFRKSGKAYLTGLAMTDDPASVGTTEFHLSSKNRDEDTLIVLGNTIDAGHFSHTSELSKEDHRTLGEILASLLTRSHEPEQFSQQQEEDDMSKETEELLKQSIEQNSKTNDLLGQVVEHLSAQNKQEDTPPNAENNEQVTKLEGQVEELSSKLGEMGDQLEKLSKQTDEEVRDPAGKGGNEKVYY